MTERILIPEQLIQYQAHLNLEEKSAITIEKYLRDSRRFYEFASGKPVTKELAIRYKQTLQEQSYALRSINSMLTSINRLFDFLGWTECKVKTLRIQRQIYCPEEKELTRAEYLRILQASKYNAKLNGILQTICGTGIRISELKYFTVEAVKNGEVSVTCKNKIRIILLPGKLRKLLLDYAKKCKIQTGIIFVTKSGNPVNRSNVWAQMKRLCENANVNPSKVFPHNLRKLFARAYYKNEKDIAKLADILGHTSIETTRIYIMTTGHEHRETIERLNLVV